MTGRMRGFFSVKEVSRETGDRISRARRAWYAFCSTVFCLFVPVVFVVMGFDNTLAIKVVEGLLSFAELMAILYLSAGVIDRADIGRHIGARWNRHEVRDQRDFYQPSQEEEPR